MVDGRSVFSDGAVPANLVSALLAKARSPCPLPSSLPAGLQGAVRGCPPHPL